MYWKNLLIVAIPTFLPLWFSTAGLADQAFHSQRLTLTRTDIGAMNGHPVLRSGQVVDIHANGPQIGALERYLLNGAKANTSYDVTLRLFDGDCDGDPAGVLTNVTLETDGHGNAHGQKVFSARDLAPFAGLVFGIQWELVSGGVITYHTLCIPVAID
jgi:hypothetical protein